MKSYLKMSLNSNFRLDTVDLNSPWHVSEIGEISRMNLSLPACPSKLGYMACHAHHLPPMRSWKYAESFFPQQPRSIVRFDKNKGSNVRYQLRLQIALLWPKCIWGVFRWQADHMTTGDLCGSYVVPQQQGHNRTTAVSETKWRHKRRGDLD